MAAGNSSSVKQYSGQYLWWSLASSLLDENFFPIPLSNFLMFMAENKGDAQCQ
jgi:hypothetical protein